MRELWLRLKWADGLDGLDWLVVAIFLLGALSPLHAQTHSATLSWGASSGATSYAALRANPCSGAYVQLGTTTLTTYKDSTVTDGATYCYEVTAINSGGTSAPSAPVMAIIPAAPPPPAATPGIYMRAGISTSYTDPSGNVWGKDTCTGGSLASPVTHAISNTTTQPLYQTERYNAPSCTFSGLTANGSYTVTLKEAEIYWSAADKRLFSVQINGTTVLSNFDLFKDAGGEFIADDKTFTATATSAGQIVVKFVNGSADYAKIDAISIVASGAPPLPPPPPPPAPAITGLACTAVFANIPSGTSYSCSITADGVTTTATGKTP